MTDLGTLGGTSSIAYAAIAAAPSLALPINGSSSHAFRYSGGVMTDLGTLGGTSGSDALRSTNSGTIVGDSWIIGKYCSFMHSAIQAVS